MCVYRCYRHNEQGDPPLPVPLLLLIKMGSHLINSVSKLMLKEDIIFEGGFKVATLIRVEFVE